MAPRLILRTIGSRQLQDGAILWETWISCAITYCQYRSHAASTVLTLWIPSPHIACTINKKFALPLCRTFKRRVPVAFPMIPVIAKSLQNVSTQLYCSRDRRKLVTKRGMLSPCWENVTWQVHSQLPRWIGGCILRTQRLARVTRD